jgi:hypothetical protein
LRKLSPLANILDWRLADLGAHAPDRRFARNKALRRAGTRRCCQHAKMPRGVHVLVWCFRF